MTIKKIKEHVKFTLKNHTEFTELDQILINVSERKTLKLNGRVNCEQISNGMTTSEYTSTLGFDGVKGYTITLVGKLGGTWFIPCIKNKLVGMLKLESHMVVE